MQPGDTLEGLARHYLNAPQQWPLLQKRNAVANPRQLRPGSVLHIPAHLLPSAPAQIAFVQGDVRTIDKTATAQPLQAGSTVPEGTRLQVCAESFVSVRLADGSVLRVPAQSDVQLQQMRRTGRTGQVLAVIELRSGGIDAQVTPSKAAQDAPRRFEIRARRPACAAPALACCWPAMGAAALRYWKDRWRCRRWLVPRAAPGLTLAKAWRWRPTARWAQRERCYRHPTCLPCPPHWARRAWWHCSWAHKTLLKK